MAAFVSIFCISNKRIRRLRDLKVSCETAKDQRGKHTSYSLPIDVKQKLFEHISSFPPNISHYSGKELKYLPSELNYRKLFTMFTEKHPELKQVSYTTYWLYFKEELPDLRFGQPQVDTCEPLSVKIKSPHLNESAKRVAVADMIVHKRKAKKSYTCIKQEVENKKNKVNDNVLANSFDYMINVSLPKIPVQELFYLRQLTGHIFDINDIQNNTATMFIYHEGQAKRCPDEVCSFLKMFLDNVPDSQKYDELHVYAVHDNYGGQNKNHAFSRFLLSLTDTGRFKHVKQIFPVVGHSYASCDRDFGILKRPLRKSNQLFTVHELTELIIKSSSTHKFMVVEVDESIILDFQSWWPTFYKKSPISNETKRKPKPQPMQFRISSLYHLEYDATEKGVCTAMTCINGVIRNTYNMAHSTHVLVKFPETLLYTDVGVPLTLQLLIVAAATHLCLM